ncbi:glyoxalase/bleomycin resistance protein/dioxygenase superfamily protein [Streptomyces sp. KS 21]|nr:glyoxalase/bleomycin resistance protein/dioxygenase superfamily protein [Streptomyces sp. KS 21]
MNLEDLVRLRRARDAMDRDYAQPLDVPALARVAEIKLSQCFIAVDVDAAFERIRAAGGEVLQEPVDQPYGVRDCAFRDPAGNMLRFNQPRPGG